MFEGALHRSLLVQVLDKVGYIVDRETGRRASISCLLMGSCWRMAAAIVGGRPQLWLRTARPSNSSCRPSAYFLMHC